MIDIILSADQAMLAPMIVVLNSALRNSQQPDQLYFHLLVNSLASKHQLAQLIEKHLIPLYPNLMFQIKAFSEQSTALQFLTDHIRVNFQGGGNLASVMNFARFFFHEVFPELDEIIYLDTDIIVQGDLTQFGNLHFEPDYHFMACPYHQLASTINEQYLKQLPGYRSNYQGFNAGIFKTQLSYWRDQQLTEQVKKIMLDHKQHPTGLFKLGTQPIMNILFFNQYQPLDLRWNTKNLGYDTRITQSTMNQAYILHWNGPQKPWLPNGLYRAHWAQYLPKTI